MTIEKGSRYGVTGAPLPDAPGGIVVRSDAEARRVVEEARAAGRPYPMLGLLGGDLAHTLGAPAAGDEHRLRSPEAVTFPVDLGQILVDGRLHLFVAYAVVRNRWWTRAVVAMNAQWIGPWNTGPRAHPNDGLVDVYDATLPISELLKVRARLPAGAHLPHPGITERRSRSVAINLDRPLDVWLDGERVDRGSHLVIRVEPDALTVVV